LAAIVFPLPAAVKLEQRRPTPAATWTPSLICTRQVAAFCTGPIRPLRRAPPGELGGRAGAEIEVLCRPGPRVFGGLLQNPREITSFPPTITRTIWAFLDQTGCNSALFGTVWVPARRRPDSPLRRTAVAASSPAAIPCAEARAPIHRLGRQFTARLPSPRCHGRSRRNSPRQFTTAPSNEGHLSSFQRTYLSTLYYTTFRLFSGNEQKPRRATFS